MENCKNHAFCIECCKNPNFLCGKFNYDKNLFNNFLKLMLATSFIYLLGMVWLGTLIGWEKPIFKLGAQPFLIAELLKILIATLVASKIQLVRDFF